MKGEEPLLDRAGVYTQLQQLLTPGSSSVLDLLPPDTRAVWQSLGAAAAAAAAKHARAGDTVDVQQEMALQRMQQLLEAAAEGQQIALDGEGDKENTFLLLNRLIPQVLAHKPFTEERDFQEERRVLFGPAEGWTDGNRCVNKEHVVVALASEAPEASGAGASPVAAAGDPSAAPSSMCDDARLHWRWQQRRVQQLRGRMRRRIWGLKGLKTEEEEEEAVESIEQQTANSNGEIVVIGRLCGEGGRRLCWATAILEPLDGSAPLQLLHLQEAVQQQQLQLQQWQISRLQKQTAAPDVLLFPGMVLAARGRLQQDGYGQQLQVSAFHCGLPVPRPLQPATVETRPGFVLLNPMGLVGRRPSLQQQQQQQQQGVDVGSCYRKQNVHILMASCSFLEPTDNGGWMLRRNAFNGLLAAIRELLPHVVVLFGPIVSWLNLQQPATAAASSAVSAAASRGVSAAASLRCAPLMQLPDFSLAHGEFFRRLAAAMQGLNCRVLLVPSSRDAMHPEPVPQPPYPLPTEQQAVASSLHCVGNPCTIQVNDVRILFTSADPLAEIAGETLAAAANCQAPKEDRMQQLCRSVVRQRTLFPRGASPRVPLDAAKLKPLLFDGDDAPHVLVFPSAAIPQQQEAPGSSSAYACAVDGRVFVCPFNPQNRLGDAFDFTSLYIHPPAESAAAADAAAAAAAADMRLPERVVVKYSVRRPRNSQKGAAVVS